MRDGRRRAGLLLGSHRHMGPEAVAGIGPGRVGGDVIARVGEVLHVEDHVPGRRQ